MTILSDFLGTVCSSCGRVKKTSHSFCGRCYYILPENMRQDLYKRFGSGYEDAFTSAQKYLEHPGDEKAVKEVIKIHFPATSDQLKASGYEFDNEAKCRGCGEGIEWWITPIGRKMPLTVSKAGDPLFTNAEVREPHWATCPNAKDFRK